MNCIENVMIELFLAAASKDTYDTHLSSEQYQAFWQYQKQDITCSDS